MTIKFNYNLLIYKDMRHPVQPGIFCSFPRSGMTCLQQAEKTLLATPADSLLCGRPGVFDALRPASVGSSVGLYRTQV